MTRSFAFLPLALSLFIAALSVQWTDKASSLLHGLNQTHGKLAQSLRNDYGSTLQVSGPQIRLPVVPIDPADRSVDPPLDIPATALRIEVAADTRDTRSDGFRLEWVHADIRMTAAFDGVDVDALLPPGTRPDWGQAVLRLPIPAPLGLARDPVVTMDGKTIPMQRLTGSHNRLSMVVPISDLPQTPVTLDLAKTTATAPMTIYPLRKGPTEITLNTQSDVKLSSGPPTTIWPTGLTSRHLHWTIDGKTNWPQKAEAGGGFLGIKIVEPDEFGAIDLYIEINRPPYDGVARLIRFTPLLLGGAALALFALGAPGIRPQLGLVALTAISASAALLLVQTLGAPEAWCVGGLIWSAGGFALFGRARWRGGLAFAVIVAGLWAALWSLSAPQMVSPGELPRTYYSMQALSWLFPLAVVTVLLDSGAALLRRRPRSA